MDERGPYRGLIKSIHQSAQRSSLFRNRLFEQQSGLFRSISNTLRRFNVVRSCPRIEEAVKSAEEALTTSEVVEEFCVVENFVLNQRTVNNLKGSNVLEPEQSPATSQESELQYFNMRCASFPIKITLHSWSAVHHKKQS